MTTPRILGSSYRRHSVLMLFVVGTAFVRPHSAMGQVAVDAATSASGNVGNLNWSHTVGAGANRLLIVGISLKGTRTVTNVTYGGAALTFLGSQVNSDAAVRLEVWYRVAPTSGTATIAVTLSGGAKLVGGAVSFSGVDQAAPLGAFASAGSTGTGTTNPSVVAASAIGDLVLDVLAIEGSAGTLTPGGTQTQRWNLFFGNSGNDAAGAGSTAPGAASVTMSWTKTGAAKWAIGAVSVHKVGFGADVTPASTAASQLPSNGTTYTTTFTVQNTGGSTDSYDLLTRKRPGSVITAVSITGSGITQGANPDSARLANLAAGSSVVAIVTYSAGNVAAGSQDTLILTARSVGSASVSDSGQLRLTVVRPSMTITKGVVPSGSAPPGTDLAYTLTITNGGTTSASSVVVVDTVQAGVQFKVGSAATSLPPGVGVLVDYSNNAGVTWTYVPTSGACSAPANYDRCVNRIRWRLQNPLSSSAPDNTGTFQFMAQIR